MLGMRTAVIAGAATLAAVALSAGGSAEAKEIKSIATFKGQATIDDFTGFFGGPKGGSFETPFTLKFTVLEDLPGTSTQHTADRDFYAGFEPASPVLATLSLASSPLDIRIDSPFASTIENSAVFKKEFAGGTGELNYFVRSQFNNGDVLIDVNVVMDVFSATNFGTVGHDWRTPFSYTFGPGDSPTGVGFFQLSFSDPVSQAAAGRHFRYSLRAETLTVEAVDDGIAAPAPEPATWALMLAGFGVAGAGLRTRRAGPRLRAQRR